MDQAIAGNDVLTVSDRTYQPWTTCTDRTTGRSDRYDLSLYDDGNDS